MQNGERLFSAFLQLWKRLPRGKGNVPLRSSFKPTKSPEIMPNLFLAEKRGKYDLHVRLVGTSIEDKTIFDFTGTNYFDGIARDQWDFYEHFVNGYCARPCAGHLLRQITSRDSIVLDLHTVAAPLAADDGEVRYIVGVGFMQRNHDVSTQMAGKEGYGMGLLNARIIDVSYIDLGFGVPEVPEISGRPESSGR